jgi:protein-S-isoprenylcysteine O-methyltransferase Ste14
MMDLGFLWPILLALAMLLARTWELQHKFRSEPGKIVETRSFKLLVAVGMASVLFCAIDYVARGSPPRHALLSAIGALVGGCTFALRAASRRALDLMWSVQVEIRDQHTLVQTGPYARIRHPIYLATLLEVAAATLLFNAWLPGSVGLVAMAWVLSRRIRIEERAMAEKFGGAWRDYCLRTGLLWPRP